MIYLLREFLLGDAGPGTASVVIAEFRTVRYQHQLMLVKRTIFHGLASFLDQ
jgi:hypothetical protein